MYRFTTHRHNFDRAKNNFHLPGINNILCLDQKPDLELKEGITFH